MVHTAATQPEGTARIRSVAPVRRHPDLDWAEFSRHWREEHAAIARQMPGMTGYTQGHAIPEEQPPERPESWKYDGCPFASFPTQAAIEELRASPGYRTRAVPDEADFTDRASMAAVLLVDAYGSPPAERIRDGRTLLVFVRGPGTDVAVGRAVEDALARVPGAGAASARRWSVALAIDPGLSPEPVAGRPFDGLLEVWFPDAPSATKVAAALATAPDALPAAFFCLVVREHEVI